jgi:hypothetical protein
VNEYVPLLAVLVFTAGQFGFWSWFVLRLSKETRARELDYLKIVRDLQNRLTAKDINGYVALRSQDEAPIRDFGPRDDAAMAKIAAERVSR